MAANSSPDLDSGLATGFAPAPKGGAVLAMQRAENTLYIAGSFTVVGGVPRNRLAAIEIGCAMSTTMSHASSTLPVSANLRLEPTPSGHSASCASELLGAYALPLKADPRRRAR